METTERPEEAAFSHGFRVTLCADLYRTLVNAMAERRQRDDLVDGEPGWVVYERTTMHNAVNRWRAELGLQPVAVSAVRSAEDQACGHVDYARKWALYCTEVALADPVNDRRTDGDQPAPMDRAEGQPSRERP